MLKHPHKKTNKLRRAYRLYGTLVIQDNVSED